MACMNRWLSTLLVLFVSLSAWAAEPQGKFQCRRYPPQTDTSPYGDPVAYIWLHSKGIYELLDLTTTKGKTSGRYSYDPKKQEIEWMTGDLSKYVGHYIPNIQGAAAIRLNTKKDPEGRVDGTLPCVRISN